MKRRAYIALPLVAFATALIVTLSVAAGTSPANVTVDDPHKKVSVSAADAQAKVMKLLPAGDHKVTYEGTRDRPGSRGHVFSGSDFSAVVDVSDGHVALLTVSIPTTSSAPRLDATQARELATKYLTADSSPIAGMVVTVAPGTGGGTPGFTVTFQRYDGDVVLPDYRVVEVDSRTGDVISLVDVRRPYTSPGKPEVAKGSAEAAAVAAVGGGRAADTFLTVSWDKAGNQVLIWQIAVEPSAPGDPALVVFIDAHSGSLFDPSK